MNLNSPHLVITLARMIVLSFYLIFFAKLTSRMFHYIIFTKQTIIHIRKQRKWADFISLRKKSLNCKNVYSVIFYKRKVILIY